MQTDIKLPSAIDGKMKYVGTIFDEYKIQGCIANGSPLSLRVLNFCRLLAAGGLLLNYPNRLGFGN